MKPWYKSATIYAVAISLVAHILQATGIGDDAAQEQATKLVAELLPFVGIVSDLVAAWARKRAQGPLTLTKQVPNA